MWTVILVIAGTILGFVLGFVRGYTTRREEHVAELRTILNSLMDMRREPPDRDRLQALIDRVTVMEESRS